MTSLPILRIAATTSWATTCCMMHGRKTRTEQRRINHDRRKPVSHVSVSPGDPASSQAPWLVCDESVASGAANTTDQRRALSTGEPAPEIHVGVLEEEAAEISIRPLAQSLPSREYAGELPGARVSECDGDFSSTSGSTFACALRPAIRRCGLRSAALVPLARHAFKLCVTLENRAHFGFRRNRIADKLYFLLLGCRQ
jgi:hypothetical protein